MRSFHSFIRILFYVAFLITAISFQVVGQLKDDPIQFAESVRTLLKSTKKPEDTQLAENFISVWSGIGSAEKEKIISIAMKMQKKKYKVASGFQQFFSGIVASINLRQINATEFSKMLAVADRVVDQLDSKTTLGYFQTVKTFFEKQALYISNYSTLYVRGGTYTFEFKDPPLPSVDTTSMSLNDTTSSLNIDQQFTNLDQTNPDDWSSWETTEGLSTDTSTTLNSPGLSTDNQAVNPLAFQQAQPTIEGPTIILENVNLTFVTHFDSVTLYNTKGSFLFKNNLFVGEGGKFDWEMAGMKEVFVEFSKYNFDVRKPKLEINDVKLTYLDKLDQPVEGIFEFESKRHQGTKDAQFPRFKSYRNDISVKNIGRNILYKGGFTLAGRRVYSSSIGDGKSLIQLSYNDQLKLRAYSSQFELADSVIRSSRAAITIYHQQDTISHPGLQLRFNKMNQQLVLLKDEGRFKKTSYLSSYFKIGFLADILKWNIQTDSIVINVLAGKSQAPAWFESEEYYNEAVFDNLKGLYTFHPLQIAVNYARKIGSSLFSIEDLAAQYKLNVKQVRASMNTLMQQGFVDVDAIGDQVLIREKGYHYILAKNNKKDYDNIIIPSVSAGKPNATIDLKKPELKINGIDRFYLSDSTNTYIEPVNKEIRIIKNRDFNFDGRINCGNFQFFGNDFRFDYDSFLVDMPIIDSIKFLVNTKERTKSGTFKKRLLVTQLELASGVLYINHPKNKSSRKNLPQYPIFDAKTGASVFFDRKEILNKAYDKSLQFQIPPFKIDSLSSSDPSTIAFSGIFKSNGLMPDFKEKLSVLPDYSLGFTHVAPPQGYPLYNTSARFYSYLTMNTHGLRGDGTISYLTTTLKSDSFTFFIDSVKTIGTIAQMKEGEVNKITFPDAKVERYEMKWLAKKDSMYISNISDPIQLYKNTAALDGTLNLTSQGTFGKGILSTRGSETRSEKYAFEKNKYTGRGAYFEIKSSVADKPSFQGDSVAVLFDLLKNQASISPEEEGDAALSFPYSQYKSSIKQAKWLLNEKKIVMSDSASDISNSYFYSTRKDQDSLVFNASGGEYDIQNSTLNIKGIPFIKVADAKIIPPKGEVIVLEDANIQPIAPARVLIDTTYEYHKLYNGSIEILSRYKFTGSAIYQFINAKSDTFDIKFDRFDFEPYTSIVTKKQEKQTVAQGLITEEDTFRIAPRIFYKGNIKMYATKKALELDGFVKLDLKKIPDYNEWIQYKRTDNVDQVLLDFDKHLTDRGKKLSAGLHIESGANSLYTTFASDKRSAGDIDVFQAKGILSYQFSSNEFRIATPGKYKGETYEGTTFIYNEDFNSIKFDGKLQFAPGNPDVEVVATGSGAARTDTADFRFNTFMTLNFKFTTKGKGLEMMGTDIKRTADSANVAKANSDFKGMLYNIANIIGDKEARDYESKSMSNYIPLASVSSSFVKTIVFSDLNLKWSEEYKAWYSIGPLGLSNIDKYDINAKVNGYVEIRKGLNGGEAITVLLEITPSVWYYFGYEEKRLTIFSSNDNFNRAVSSKAKLGRPGEYGVMLGSVMDELSFIQRFKAAYLGINRPIEEQIVPPVDQNDSNNTLPDENKVLDLSTPPDSTDTNGF